MQGCAKRYRPVGATSSKCQCVDPTVRPLIGDCGMCLVSQSPSSAPRPVGHRRRQNAPRSATAYRKHPARHPRRGCRLVVAYGVGQLLLTLVISDKNRSTLTVAPDRILLAFQLCRGAGGKHRVTIARALQSSQSAVAPGLKGSHSEHVGRLTGRKIPMSVRVAISLALLASAVRPLTQPPARD